MRGAGDPQRVIELCDRALGLFHGEVLPAAADAAWAQPYRLRLTRLVWAWRGPPRREGGPRREW